MLFQHDTPINRLLNLAIEGGALNKLVEATAIGNPAMFTTEVSKPLKGFTIPFYPVYSGSGDPTPSNVRDISGWTGVGICKAGKNLLPYPYYDNSQTFSDGFKYTISEDGSVSISGTTTAVRYLNLISNTAPIMLKAGKYAARGTGNSEVRFCVYSASGSALISTYNGGTFTLEGDTAIYAYLRTSSGVSIESLVVYPQIEVAETVSDFEEYKGETIPIMFPAMGANQWNESTKSGYYNTTTGRYVEVAGQLCSYGFIPAKPNTEYRLIKPNTRCDILFYDIDGVILSSTRSGETSFVFTTPTGCYYMAYNLGSDYGETYANNVSINYPASKTAYEPFTNTVYGGEIDAINGTMTVYMIARTKKWGDMIDTGSTGSMKQRLLAFDMPIVAAGQTGAGSSICNVAVYLWAGTTNETPHFYTNYSPSYETYAAYVILPADTDDDLEVTVCAMLATPQTVQLDPITVQTLVGENTIWTNSNGTNEVNYLKKG